MAFELSTIQTLNGGTASQLRFSFMSLTASGKVPVSMLKRGRRVFVYIYIQ